MSNLADLELVAPAGAEAEVAALGLGGPRRRFRVPLLGAPPARELEVADRPRAVR